jgi:ABC-type transport system involved in multi-copper enzyme maturation permease subunit
VTGLLTIARYALEEALRRKVFLVVLVLTVLYVGLYWLGTDLLFGELDTSDIDESTGLEVHVLASATLFGLAMFGTLFLGTVLAVFLTLTAVRGDAERGLLQPLVVRPVGRTTFLLARFLSAATVCAAYVLVVYAATMVATRSSSGSWWPDQVVRPGLELAAAVVVVAALSLLGSVFLSSVANGIAVFMLFGAGLVAGLLGQIGDALNSDTLSSIAKTTAWALPFEALYQDALHGITADTTGLTGFALSLGPFGGAEIGGSRLPFWAAAYIVIAGLVALVGFARKDL